MHWQNPAATACTLTIPPQTSAVVSICEVLYTIQYQSTANVLEGI